MNFHIIDTQSAYRRLLNAATSAEREQIFCDELVRPFDALVQVFGGDGLRAFAGWGMTPDMTAGDQRDHWHHTLDTLTRADAWNRSVESLHRAWAAFQPVADQIPPKDITFGLFLSDMSANPLARGYSGFGAFPGYIMTVYGDANAYNLPRIEACTVHEFHHNIHARLFPFNPMRTTVAQYMIMEGLAESFAAELYSEDVTGYWVAEFDDTDLAETKRIMFEGLHRTGFDVIRGYIFGSTLAQQYGMEDVNLPDFAGYALGYRVVQAYLQRTGKTVVEATFTPADDIIAESRYFED